MRYACLLLLALPLRADLVTILPESYSEFLVVMPFWAANPSYDLILVPGYYRAFLGAFPCISPGLWPNLRSGTDASIFLNADDYFLFNGEPYVTFDASLPTVPGRQFVFSVRNSDQVPYGVFLNSDYGFTPIDPTPVPEPPSFWLLSGGMAALIYRHRSQRLRADDATTGALDFVEQDSARDRRDAHAAR